jgi:hypothetical protein
MYRNATALILDSDRPTIEVPGRIDRTKNVASAARDQDPSGRLILDNALMIEASRRSIDVSTCIGRVPPLRILTWNKEPRRLRDSAGEGSCIEQCRKRQAGQQTDRNSCHRDHLATQLRVSNNPRVATYDFDQYRAMTGLISVQTW